MDVKLLFIQYLQSLSPLSKNTIENVLAIFKEDTIAKNEYFVRAGYSSSKFAFLASGVARAFYCDNDNTEYIKHFFIAPSIIGGYSSLITGNPNQINQQALTGCTILIADYNNLKKLYDKFADLERLGRRFAENYFVEKEKKEFEIILNNADKRYEIFRRQYPELEQIIPQYHIASYLGISATQLSRIRKKLSGK